MDDKKRFTLRIPQDLFDEVKENADKTKRSVAKEIEFILEKYFEENSIENELSAKKE